MKLMTIQTLDGEAGSLHTAAIGVQSRKSSTRGRGDYQADCYGERDCATISDIPYNPEAVISANHTLRARQVSRNSLALRRRLIRYDAGEDRVEKRDSYQWQLAVRWLPLSREAWSSFKHFSLPS